ncbi:exodeoxyribonuclease III [Pendulispora brunnea]|uniref:Exodeoxyribonuclease III n=1 Tax=Pendulispora brunnea TaxID=2905690 RepID=A0ABZ2KRL1_9BACT
MPAILAQFGTPEVLCLQETRIRMCDTEDIANMQLALPGYRCHFSLNRDARNVTYRGGRAYGVVTYIRESLGPANMERPEWDLEGRIVFTHLRGRVIGNVYAVNGTDKPYFDHELGMMNGDRHAFKRRFQERVIHRAHELRASGGVILAGDWNVSPTKLDTYPRLRTEEPHVRARAALAELLARSGMVDIYRHLHPEERRYTWFNRRARPGRLDAARVDYILVSEDLVPHVRSASILDDPRDRGGSDHAPTVVDTH